MALSHVRCRNPHKKCFCCRLLCEASNMCVGGCVRVSQGAMACCRRKERKVVSDEENSEMDADPSTSEEEVPGSLNITDEMKRMLNQLWVFSHKHSPPQHTHTPEPSALSNGPTWMYSAVASYQWFPAMCVAMEWDCVFLYRHLVFKRSVAFKICSLRHK